MIRTRILCFILVASSAGFASNARAGDSFPICGSGAGLSLGQPCDDADCKCSFGEICDAGYCLCRKGFVESGQRCVPELPAAVVPNCGSLGNGTYGAHCDESCACAPNEACVDEVCQCATGYEFYGSVNDCLPKSGACDAGNAIGSECIDTCCPGAFQTCVEADSETSVWPGDASDLMMFRQQAPNGTCQCAYGYFSIDGQSCEDPWGFAEDTNFCNSLIPGPGADGALA